MLIKYTRNVLSTTAMLYGWNNIYKKQCFNWTSSKKYHCFSSKSFWVYTTIRNNYRELSLGSKMARGGQSFDFWYLRIAKAEWMGVVNEPRVILPQLWSVFAIFFKKPLKNTFTMLAVDCLTLRQKSKKSAIDNYQ